MLILAKSILGLMIGFFITVILGYFMIPLLKRIKFGQVVSTHITKRHLQKEGTPTIGGLIFIIPTVITMILLYLRGSLNFSYNLTIVMFVFISYSLLGFIDDYLKVKKHNNDGLSIIQKLIAQVFIALVFFYIYMRSGGDTLLEITSLNISIDLKWTYGLFILFLLVGTSNAVNISDGEDGLAAGLSAIAFLSFGIITWGTSWVEGYQEMAIFCFILVGSLLGFLVYNTHPAKVFMGDTGSLGLGATLASIAILSKHELSLALIGGVFIAETLSSLIQIISIRKFNKKIFRMAPLHHHFEQLGWEESDIVKLFWIVGFMLGMFAVYYGVWL